MESFACVLRSSFLLSMVCILRGEAIGNVKPFILDRSELSGARTGRTSGGLRSLFDKQRPFCGTFSGFVAASGATSLHFGRFKGVKGRRAIKSERSARAARRSRGRLADTCLRRVTFRSMLQPVRDSQWPNADRRGCSASAIAQAEIPAGRLGRAESLL